MEFSPCIIIPSYAATPSRVAKALILFDRLQLLFENVPIYVLAQDWTLEDMAKVRGNITMIHKPKLGITPARQELRKWVLENTEHSYFIMCDDDCEPFFYGNLEDGRYMARLFLETMQEYPNGYALPRYPFYLNFNAISRPIFQAVEFPNLSVQPIEGYELGSEDLAFTAQCSMRFPKNRYYLSVGIVDGRLDDDNLKNSTWCTGGMTLAKRIVYLDATLAWLRKQEWFLPLPDNELCYSQLANNTFYLWETLDAYGTVKSVFGLK